MVIATAAPTSPWSRKFRASALRTPAKRSWHEPRISGRSATGAILATRPAHGTTRPLSALISSSSVPSSVGGPKGPESDCRYSRGALAGLSDEGRRAVHRGPLDRDARADGAGAASGLCVSALVGDPPSAIIYHCLV